MEQQPNIDYTKYLFYQPPQTIQYGAGSNPGNGAVWRPPSGQPGDEGRWIQTIPGFYFSKIGNTYRPITGVENSGIDLSKIQNGQFGGDPNDPGPKTTGGANSFDVFKGVVYAMDPQVRDMVDNYNNNPQNTNKVNYVTNGNPNLPPSGGSGGGSPAPAPAAPSQPVFYPGSVPLAAFKQGLSSDQQSSINHLLGMIAIGYKPNANDISNLTYAVGNSWQQYIPKNPTYSPDAQGSGSSPAANNAGASGATQNNSPLPASANSALDALTDHLTNTPINPDVAITPDLTAQYLEQAKQELGPYFKQLFDQAKQDLTAGLSGVSTDLAASERSLEAKYGQDLQAKQEEMAKRGLTYSTIRSSAEQNIADTTQAAIDAGRRLAAQKATTIGNTGERALGTSNLPDLPKISDAPTPILNQPGVYSFSKPSTTRDLFTPAGGTTGTLTQDQLAATNARALDLTNNERNYRTLNTV